MLKHCTTLLLLLFSFFTKGNIIEIRYKVLQATQVAINWGVNGWNILPDKPAGTIVKGMIMRTPMIKSGEDYVVKINLPDSSTIDYYFSFTKPAGVFNLKFNYTDVPEKAGIKFYHNLVDRNMLIKHSPEVSKLQRDFKFPLIKYAALVLFVFTLLAVILFSAKRFIIKSPKISFGPAVLFFAIAMMLLCLLILIRVMVTGMAGQFLFAPLQTLPLIFKTAYSDFFYTVLVTLLFAVPFFFRKSWRIPVLYLFGFISVLSIVLCLLNIRVIELLGSPFSYQWLYYSDFLKSTDASEAIKANLDKSALAAYSLMILAAAPLTWLLYQGLIGRWKKLILVIFLLCLGIGYFSKNTLPVASEKIVNPVIYFLSSLINTNGLGLLTDKNAGDQKKFLVKNNNVIDPLFAAKISKAGIKNVIVVVLESTAAEYITNYNPTYQSTPFLASLRSSSAMFNAFYAHSPATNKSMVSILCSVYPYLSFKTITEDAPDISWRSITSELEKTRYNTSFFNSGDNRFQGAENFLKNRGFDKLMDYREGACTTGFYADSLLPDDNKGMNDLCLPVNFFNWIDKADSMPFFSMMWTYQTHYPYYPKGSNINFNTNNESLEKYLNALRNADNALQQLVEGLKKRQLFNSTLIVVLGDHGEAFGRHGQTAHAGGLFEENIHIPLLFINPLLFAGEKIETPGGLSDLAPTIFSILGKPVPVDWQGENLFSLKRRNKVYFFNPYSDYLFGCRDGNYKFIYNATKNISALYDLKTDPNESVNIADTHPEYVKELNNDLAGWIHYQDNYVSHYLK